MSDIPVRTVRSKDVQLWHMYRGESLRHYYLFFREWGDGQVMYYSIRQAVNGRRSARVCFRSGVSFNFTHEDPKRSLALKMIFESDWSKAE